MKISRRHFLIGTGLLSVSPNEWAESESIEKLPKDQIRVVQCATDQNSTLITVVAHRSRKLKFFIRGPIGRRAPNWTVTPLDFKLADYVIYQIHVVDLLLRKDYRLEVLDVSLGRYHWRVFQALDDEKEDLQIVFMTCTSHRRADPQEKMFRQLKKVSPDVIFFGGDLVYANSVLETVLGQVATPEEAYAVYIKTLFELDFYKQERLIPVFSVWDDHDMGRNNSDINHPYLALITQIFRAFFPVDSRIGIVRPGPGVSFAISLKGFQTVFLDSRSFLDTKNERMYGAEQIQWVRQQLQESSQPTLFLSAVQFWDYGRLAETADKTSPAEMAELKRLIKNHGYPSLFLSGDVHYSQVQTVPATQVGFPTYEITSSAVFSISSRFFGKRSVEQGQLDYYGYPNFLVFEKLKVDEKGLTLNVRCVSEDSLSEFDRKIEVKI